MPGDEWPWMYNRSPGEFGSGRAPEMIEADVVEGGGRCKRRNMPAEFTGLAVGPHHHRHRVPADDRADLPFQVRVTGYRRFQVGGNGVDVLGGRLERQLHAGASRQFDHALQQLVRTLGAVVVQHRFQRFQPLLGFGRVAVVVQDVIQPAHAVYLCAIKRQSLAQSRLGGRQDAAHFHRAIPGAGRGERRDCGDGGITRANGQTQHRGIAAGF